MYWMRSVGGMAAAAVMMVAICSGDSTLFQISSSRVSTRVPAGVISVMVTPHSRQSLRFRMSACLAVSNRATWPVSSGW